MHFGSHQWDLHFNVIWSVLRTVIIKRAQCWRVYIGHTIRERKRNKRKAGRPASTKSYVRVDQWSKLQSDSRMKGMRNPPLAAPESNNICSRTRVFYTAASTEEGIIPRRVDEALTIGLKKLGSFRLPSLSRFVRSLIFGWPPVGYVSRPPTRESLNSGITFGCLGSPWIAPACDATRRSRFAGDRLSSRKRIVLST